MRKWVFRLITFLISLALGVGASSVWNGPRPVSLCEIDANPDKYGGKILRLRVLVSNDVFSGAPVTMGSQISAFSACTGTGDWPGASVDLDPRQISLVPETKHVWRQENEKFYVTDAILVGRFEPPDGMLHCFSPKYQISTARIERVISSQELQGFEQVSKWVKSNSR